jgi:type II secretory pathway component PulF
MKYDEFAFFNQQLAAMLREGLPLEGALKELCANMRSGALRSEMELLEADLKTGVPLGQALAARRLPEFYVQMIQIGVRGNDLPGVLLMLADYYQRVDSVWTRLKGLLVYPLIVLVAALGLSCFLSILASRVVNSGFPEVMGIKVPPMILANLWAPPILIGLLLATLLLILFVPAWRRGLRWHMPAFKEAKLAQVAGAMSLLLKSGGNLGDALGLVRQMEKGTAASNEMGQWQSQLAAGRGQFPEMADAGTVFPPMFLWLVSNAGEDLAAGFRRAAEIYSARANHRIEMLLYAALPFAILALGIMICCQIMPVIGTFVSIMNGIDASS